MLKVGFSKDSTYKPLYKLAGDCLANLKGEHEAALFHAAFEDFKNAEKFYQLGAHFNKVNYFDLAVPFLDRALRLDVSLLKAALELSIAHASRAGIKEAIFALNRVQYTHNFWTTFQMQYLRVLLADVKDAKEFIEGAREQFIKEGQDNFEEPLAALTMLEEMVNRHVTVPEPGDRIREWHFIQHGAACLDYFWDSEEYVAGGRYVALWGYPETLRNVLEKLKRYLSQMESGVEEIYFLPDRSSQIVGLAAAKLLGLPYHIVGKEYKPSANQLIIAADNRAFNQINCLEWVKENQVLFALNLDWLTPQRYVPDVCGHFSQAYYPFWEGGGISFCPETQKVRNAEGDDRAPEVIADLILESEPEINPLDEATEKFYLSRKEFMKGGASDGGKRNSFSPISPVPGAYFH